MANEPVINTNIRARTPMPSAIASERGGRTPGRIFPYYRPQRLVLIDLSKSSDEALRTLHVLMNPESFSIAGASEYSRLDVPGYSQQVVQWSHTESLEYTFQLRWSYHVASELEGNRGQKRVDANFARDWLLSFLHPTSPGRAPALMQAYWPNFLSVIGSVTDVGVPVTRWSNEGVPMDYTIDLTLLETRRIFVSATLFLFQGLHTPLPSGISENVGGPEVRDRSLQRRG